MLGGAGSASSPWAVLLLVRTVYACDLSHASCLTPDPSARLMVSLTPCWSWAPSTASPWAWCHLHPVRLHTCYRPGAPHRTDRRARGGQFGRGLRPCPLLARTSSPVLTDNTPGLWLRRAASQEAAHAEPPLRRLLWASGWHWGCWRPRHAPSLHRGLGWLCRCSQVCLCVRASHLARTALTCEPTSVHTGLPSLRIQGQPPGAATWSAA